MAINKGVAPPDYNTDTGAFRALVGDIQYVALVPPETGYGNYTWFSDAEIEVYLAQGGDDLNQAAGFAYRSLAGQAALAAGKIQDYDLQVDTTKRAEQLNALADFYFGQGDGADFFVLADIGPMNGPCRCCLAELGPGCFCGDCEWC